MAKVKDITDKLSFDENPCLVIRGKKLEVNADAPTMLKIMGLMSREGMEMEHVAEAYELVFPKKSRDEIEKMKPGVNDWMTIVEEAMALIMGEDENPGEQ